MHLLSQSQLLLLICAQRSFCKAVNGEPVGIMFTHPSMLGNNPSTVQSLHFKRASKIGQFMQKFLEQQFIIITEIKYEENDIKLCVLYQHSLIRSLINASYKTQLVWKYKTTLCGIMTCTVFIKGSSEYHAVLCYIVRGHKQASENAPFVEFKQL